MPSGSLPRLTETRINHYLNLANNACYYSDFMKARLGAVLIYKSKVMSVGWNSTKTSPLQRELNRYRGYDVDSSIAHNTLHAEVACLTKAKDLDIDWGRASLFVCRIKKDGTRGISRPCKGCMALIKSLGIKNLYYTTNEGWCYERIDQMNLCSCWEEYTKYVIKENKSYSTSV